MRDPAGFRQFEHWVEGLIAEQLNLRRDRMNPASRITGDFGVGGAEGWELMEMLHQKTGVVFGDDFPTRAYFGDEVMIPVHAPFEWMAKKLRGDRSPGPGSLDLTVRALTLYVWEHGGRMPPGED